MVRRQKPVLQLCDTIVLKSSFERAGLPHLGSVDNKVTHAQLGRADSALLHLRLFPKRESIEQSGKIMVIKN
jgi:hypothetical protein